jgi:hypothetical protein
MDAIRGQPFSFTTARQAAYRTVPLCSETRRIDIGPKSGRNELLNMPGIGSYDNRCPSEAERLRRERNVNVERGRVRIWSPRSERCSPEFRGKGERHYRWEECNGRSGVHAVLLARKSSRFIDRRSTSATNSMNL